MFCVIPTKQMEDTEMFLGTLDFWTKIQRGFGLLDENSTRIFGVLGV